MYVIFSDRGLWPIIQLPYKSLRVVENHKNWTHNTEVELSEKIFKVLDVEVAALPAAKVVEDQDLSPDLFGHRVAVEKLVTWVRFDLALHLECWVKV